jgi:protease-4
MALPFIARAGVGVVELFGVVGSSIRVPVYARIFEHLRRDRRFRAVVVDIDSPGGTAAGSDYLYHSLARLAERKPVVAFIRGVGASGAYYISCAATRVVAIPTALVGSIGVLSVRPVLQELLRRLGIGFAVYKGGRLKDMWGFWRSPTPEEGAKLQELVDEFYNAFIRVVARGRQMDEARVRELATGELFTARRAKELGLIDEVGDLERSIELAAEMGRVRRRPIWVRPRRPFLERLVGRFAQSLAEEVVGEVEKRLSTGVYFWG